MLLCLILPFQFLQAAMQQHALAVFLRADSHAWGSVLRIAAFMHEVVCSLALRDLRMLVSRHLRKTRQSLTRTKLEANDE